nr:cytochrome b6/f complex subunit VI [Cuscuta indecora]WEY30047.1 cytochrome b6/f complex subunit VI [Cuscuta indecora]
MLTTTTFFGFLLVTFTLTLGFFIGLSKIRLI